MARKKEESPDLSNDITYLLWLLNEVCQHVDAATASVGDDEASEFVIVPLPTELVVEIDELFHGPPLNDRPF